MISAWLYCFNYKEMAKREPCKEIPKTSINEIIPSDQYIFPLLIKEI